MGKVYETNGLVVCHWSNATLAEWVPETKSLIAWQSLVDCLSVHFISDNGNSRQFVAFADIDDLDTGGVSLLPTDL